MADTTLQKEEVESYVREELAKRFETALEERGVPLKDVIGNGKFKFDAVDADITIAVNISTSSLRTTSGMIGMGKVHKIRSDMLYLLLADLKEPGKRVIAFTQKCMYDYFQKKQNNGRVPCKIELEHVELPPKLQDKLELSRQRAAKEVQPNKQE